jgi:hypothetical protein
MASELTEKAKHSGRLPQLGSASRPTRVPSDAVPTTTPWRAQPESYRRPRWRRPLIVLTIIAALLAVAGYMGYSAYRHYVTQLLTVPGCQAGTGTNATPLDFGQAQDAATIADVAVYDHLPQHALTIAYATAIQESKLENLDYGTDDSVGIFQQRPSMGWGTVQELENPVYASQAFFETGPSALIKVPGYASMPVSEAAQAVQRSADGSAYQQWATEGAQLAADFTTTPAAVTCWYDPSTQAAQEGASTKLNLSGALTGLEGTFGIPREDGIVTGVTTVRSGNSEIFSTTKAGGWSVANWLVTHASSYGITQVSYGGYQWTASLTETSWQADPAGAAGSIVAS